MSYSNCRKVKEKEKTVKEDRKNMPNAKRNENKSYIGLLVRNHAGNKRVKYLKS